MRRQHQLLAIACLSPLVVTLASCAATRKSEGLSSVDDLLTRVEQVQIESVVAREKASAAFDAYGQIVTPEFEGDPMLLFNDLVEKVELSKVQAQKLAGCVAPMKNTADGVFLAWTADLEKFGNTNMRQASQARLAETRARYSAVLDAANAALVSMNAFNSDLSDQALFLQHDFNAGAVEIVAAQVPALTNQARDLGKRLNDCVTTSKAYISSGALRGQLDAAPTQPAPVAVQKPAAPPARKLANPMVDSEGQSDIAANTQAPVTAPAKRRPRANPIPATPSTESTEPSEAPVTAPDTSSPASGSQPTSQPVSKPAADLGSRPAKPATTQIPPKTQTTGAGAGGGR